MDTATAATVAGTGVVVCGAMIAVAGTFLKLSRRMDQFREDWEGQPPRKGFDPVPGVPERLKKTEDKLEQVLAQLKPNGGSTFRDALNRVELAQHRQGIDHAILVRRLDAQMDQTAPMVAELVELRREMTELQRAQNAVTSDDGTDPTEKASP